MTRARNGAASAAPDRAVTWYPLPFDEGVPKFAPACGDGDEILVRKADGTVVTCTVDRRRGCYFVGPDGEAVEAEAIASPTRRAEGGPTMTHAERRSKGWRRLEVMLDERTMGRLEEICEESGYSKAEQVRAMIDGDYEEWRKLEAR